MKSNERRFESIGPKAFTNRLSDVFTGNLAWIKDDNQSRQLSCGLLEIGKVFHPKHKRQETATILE